SIATFTVFHKAPVWIQVKEQLILFSLLKPGVDVYRTTMKDKLMARKRREEERTRRITGEKKNEEEHITEQLVDERFQLTTGRAIEMCAEAIPGTVIQMSAFLGSSDFTALVSLLSSAGSAAFMSAVISYEWDTDPEGRINSQFYGYIPRGMGRKVLIFALQFTQCFSCLFVRAAALGLLSLRGGREGGYAALAFLGAELGVYFAVKIWRNDYVYWLDFEGWKKHAATAIERLIVKLLTDWVSTHQFRIPYEVGGAAYSFSILTTLAFGAWAALGYEKLGEGDLEEADVRLAMGTCCLCLVGSYGAFLLVIERSHVRSFFDTRTGSQYLCQEWAYYKENKLMKNMFVILNGYRESYWVPHIGEEVKEWLNNDALPKLLLGGRDVPWFDSHV
ncbi:hypothetical protein TrRE_jg8480, partial [Triparma retinervis]